MDDFSSPNITNMYGVPPSPENFIQPGKRPMSSMNPTVIVDGNGNTRLVIGAAGGTKITSATAWAIIRNLRFNETIKEAIDARRIHHQLYPMTLEYEYGVLQDIVTGLETIGHNSSRYDVGESMVSGLARDENGHINANADFRRIAVIAGY
ncbi:hypothetical protein B566_EDAN011015 [Ephemera danica]|nr:hypothetical protein B566_EDAN011015 [Ephemera danica]